MGLIEDLTVIGEQLTAFKYYLYASVAILVYDYILTFEDEVKYIWRQKFTFGTLLFLITRYYAPLSFALSVYGSYALYWNDPMCFHVTTMESVNSIILISAAIFGMLIRTHVLYMNNKLVLLYLLPFQIAFIATASYNYTRPNSGPLPLPTACSDTFKGCFLIPDYELGRWAATPVIIAFAYDMSIFILTVARTIHVVRSYRAAIVFYTILKNGALYFLIIGAANLVTIMFICFGPTGLKFINFNPTIVLIVVLVNRSTLDLRKGCRMEQTMLHFTDISVSIHFGSPSTEDSNLSSIRFRRDRSVSSAASSHYDNPEVIERRRTGPLSDIISTHVPPSAAPIYIQTNLATAQSPGPMSSRMGTRSRRTFMSFSMKPAAPSDRESISGGWLAERAVSRLSGTSSLDVKASKSLE